MNPSTALARVLVDELIAGGVTDAVLAPGSRNAPLSVALFDADAAGRLRLHVRIDERTAGFLAIGLARASGRTVAVATTSGTAVANLHPAVLEAHHGGVPLLVFSADRPPAMRDVGANQVIDQRAVFGGALRFFHELAVPHAQPGQNAYWRSMVCRALAHTAGAATGFPGPVQLNVPLVEPLLPDDDTDWPESLEGADVPWTAVAPVGSAQNPIAAPEPGERCLFVADLTHPAAGPIARAGHLVISESGGAAGAATLNAGLHLLADKDFLARNRPDRIIVLGRATMYRPITRLLADPAITVDVVASPAAYPDLAGRARSVSPALAAIEEPGEPQWVSAWRDANTAAQQAVAKVLDELDIAASPRLARELVAALPAEATLVLGSSQPPRDVGRFTTGREGLTLVANRGVAGIDGTVSTAVGAALAQQPDKPAFAFLGDLTFLHDLTGLIIGPHEPRPDLTIVVSNNDGGGIFATLEPGEQRHTRSFERVFGTPHAAMLGPIVEGLGAEHLLVSTADELQRELTENPGGIRVIEVPTTRTDLRAINAAVGQAVKAALQH